MLATREKTVALSTNSFRVFTTKGKNTFTPVVDVYRLYGLSDTLSFLKELKIALHLITDSYAVEHSCIEYNDLLRISHLIMERFKEDGLT